MPATFSDFNSLLTAATALPLDDRVRLLDALASTVPDEAPSTLHPAWEAELQRRDDGLASGEVSGDSWQTVRSRLFKQAGLEVEN